MSRNVRKCTFWYVHPTSTAHPYVRRFIIVLLVLENSMSVFFLFFFFAKKIRLRESTIGTGHETNQWYWLPLPCKAIFRTARHSRGWGQLFSLLCFTACNAFSERGIYFIRKAFAPSGGIIFPNRVDPSSEGDKTNWRVASCGSVTKLLK